MGMSSTRRWPGIQERFLELVNYLGGVLGDEHGQESRNFLFLVFLITKVPKNLKSGGGVWNYASAVACEHGWHEHVQ